MSDGKIGTSTIKWIITTLEDSSMEVGRDCNGFYSGIAKNESKSQRHLDVIYDHLVCNGPSPLHADWICEVSQTKLGGTDDFEDCEMGIEFEDNLEAMFNYMRKNFENQEGCEDEPNADAKKFFRHVEEGKQPLYPSCTTFSRLSFLIRFYHLKCVYGISEFAFGELVKLIKEAFPDANLPLSFNAAKSVIRDLGLDYEKINACPNSCMLYWGKNKEKNECETCGVSRWVVLEKDGIIENNDPPKLFHKVAANVMRYFPLRPRLQRMFLCKDFFRLMRWHPLGRTKDGKLRHPTDALAWKVMDARYPDFAAENRNVRLGVVADGFNPYRSMNLSHSTWPIVLPLISEWKALWKDGVETYDSLTCENFNLRASALWTISDFPGYTMFSGWSTKGKLACPECHYETSSVYLKHSKKTVYVNHRKFLDPTHEWRLDKKRFNSEMEMGNSPVPLTGTEIEELLWGYENQFGDKTRRKRKRDRGIRKPLHPIKSDDGKHIEIMAAIFDMTNKEKENFCSLLKNAKLSYDCASNVSRYVHIKERKMVGYKSHDAHFILHYLLQFAVKNTLKPEVALPMIRLGSFLRGMWSKVVELDDIKKLQREIVVILCEFEMIFTEPFFDIMVHLPIHLCREVEYGGPEHLHCMFAIERYLGKLKGYVRNRSRPKGSIAEGYLAEECVIFCSRFLDVDGVVENNSNDFGKYGTNVEYHIGTKKNKDGRIFKMKDADWKAAHRYILFNSDNKEIESLIEEHRAFMDGLASQQKYKRERAHMEDFWKWLKDEVLKKENISRDLEVFALGPNRLARKFTGYVINGYRFHTKFRDSRCTTQNSGIFLTAETTTFASSKDQNPVVGGVNYYGSIEEIFELDYWGAFTVVLFKCCWYQEEKDPFGLTRVNFNKLRQKSDPFVLSSQVQQVFYVDDPVEKNCQYVIKKLPRDWCDTENSNAMEEVSSYHSYNIGINCETEGVWIRDDVPLTQIRVPSP
ncbi:uncharacterized protein LOC141714684 [Apium graveolens]|uniref:uncharacterized protein LOC141714684 n=1 Tax=Apium graveolens TaxID=4045 RepID=UPI003D792290